MKKQNETCNVCQNETCVCPELTKTVKKIEELIGLKLVENGKSEYKCEVTNNKIFWMFNPLQIYFMDERIDVTFIESYSLGEEYMSFPFNGYEIKMKMPLKRYQLFNKSFNPDIITTLFVTFKKI